ACRDDDVFCLVRRDRAVGRGDVDDIAGFEYAAALGPRDLVLAEQELDAFRVLPDDIVLALEHPGKIERNNARMDAVVRGMELRELEMLRAGEQRLRRNAADVDAGAAEGLVLLDADGLEA